MNAYFAGLFDGDGSISIILRLYKKSNRQPCHYLSCSLTSTNKKCIELLKLNFGGKIVVTQKKTKKRKQCWCWSVANLEALNFLLSIKNFLRIKLPQALVGINFQNRRKPNNKLTDDEVFARECYRQFIWELNGFASMGKKANSHRVILDVTQSDFYTNCRNIIKDLLTNEISTEYVAGIFDAEGNVSITKDYLLQAQISSTNKQILDDIKGKFGGLVKRVHGPTTRSSELWVWLKKGSDALNFLKSIRPWLVTKKNQVSIGIEFHEKKLRYRPLPELELKKRETYRQAIWRLNGSSSRSRCHDSAKYVIEENNPLFLKIDEMIQNET